MKGPKNKKYWEHTLYNSFAWNSRKGKLSMTIGRSLLIEEEGDHKRKETASQGLW
jgi:hypothetical protein